MRLNFPRVKKTMLFFVITVLVIGGMTSCVKENTPTLANESFVPTSSDSLVYEGTFVSDDHPTSGDIQVFTDGLEQVISVSNFDGDNGPALRVYLSANLSDDDFIDLGDLVAVKGDFSYTTAVSTDLDKYKNVLIWCEEFSVLFGHATLQSR